MADQELALLMASTTDIRQLISGTFGYRLSPRFLVRADYEYQMWPGYVGVKGQHGLTPNGFTVGVSYRLFR